MSSGLPAYPDDLLSPEALASKPPALSDYGDIEAMLQAAERQGIVEIPANDAVEARSGASNRIRDPVIAERLNLLGYLEDPADVDGDAGSTARSRFLAAIEAFQAEAGLDADAWAGPVTWRALQQLVTFEVATAVGKWFDPEQQPRPALVRALRLRLFALGLLGRRPGQTPPELPHAELEAFWILCCRLRIGTLGDPTPELPELLGLLFDQDRLLEAVVTTTRTARIGGRERQVFSYAKLTTERRREVDPQVAQFLACMAKIELWLLGFDVDITHVGNYPVYRFDRNGTRSNQKLRRALDAFFDQLGGRDRRLRASLTPELFAALVAPPAPPSAAAPAASSDTARGDPDFSREVAEALRDRDRLDNAWELGRQLGMKLWDGMRRLLRWLHRGLRRILEVGRNLARAFFRYAMNGYAMARGACIEVGQALGAYVRGSITTGSAIQLIIERDGDMRLTLPPEGEAAATTAALRTLRLFAAGLQLGARLLSLLLRILRSATAGALGGWARLLWLLLQGYRDMRPLWLQLRALQAAARTPATA